MSASPVYAKSPSKISRTQFVDNDWFIIYEEAETSQCTQILDALQEEERR